MKLRSLYTIIFIFIFSVSCSNDNDISLIQPSTTLIEMEGEGGEAEVFITGEDWKIAEVVNKEGDVRIHGDIYSADGEQIEGNTVLSLEEQGKIEAFWSNKGFRIIRDTPSSLKLQVKENSTGEDFNFVIKLRSGEEMQEITVMQKKSQGYTFDSIEYSLKEGDGDSLYMSKAGMIYKHDIQTSQPVTFSPFNGIDINKRSSFKSMDNGAFVWLKNDSAMVKVPTGIHDNEIYFNGEKRLYTSDWTTSPHGFEGQMETVTLPAGKSEFSVEKQYRSRKVSYTLTLINNRTKVKKIIKGKWVEIAPTGEYVVKWQD